MEENQNNGFNMFFSGKMKLIMLAMGAFVVLFVVFLSLFMIESENNSTISSVNVFPCSSGVLVKASENYQTEGLIDIEDYVKGVVYSKYSEKGKYYSTFFLEAYAILVRTYTYAVTNECDTYILNGENNQIYQEVLEDNSTINMIMKDTANKFITIDKEVVNISYDEDTLNQVLEALKTTTSIEQIFQNIYGEEIKVQKISYVNEEGLEMDPETGFMMRLSRPLRTNKYYYDLDTGFGRYLEGECAWYATTRAKEILASINSDKSWTANVNGGKYCGTSDSNKFAKSYDYKEPRQGAIVSWMYGNYGHVAIVEKVEGNTVTISEAYNGIGKYGTWYVCDGGYNCSVRRKTNCEANGSGCFQTRTTTIEQIKNYSGTNTFECYIYLVE